MGLRDRGVDGEAASVVLARQRQELPSRARLLALVRLRAVELRHVELREGVSRSLAQRDGQRLAGLLPALLHAEGPPEAHLRAHGVGVVADRLLEVLAGALRSAEGEGQPAEPGRHLGPRQGPRGSPRAAPGQADRQRVEAVAPHVARDRLVEAEGVRPEGPLDGGLRGAALPGDGQILVEPLAGAPPSGSRELEVVDEGPGGGVEDLSVARAEGREVGGFEHALHRNAGSGAQQANLLVVGHAEVRPLAQHLDGAREVGEALVVPERGREPLPVANEVVRQVMAQGHRRVDAPPAPAAKNDHGSAKTGQEEARLRPHRVGPREAAPVEGVDLGPHGSRGNPLPQRELDARAKALQVAGELEGLRLRQRAHHVEVLGADLEPRPLLEVAGGAAREQEGADQDHAQPGAQAGPPFCGCSARPGTTERTKSRAKTSQSSSGAPSASTTKGK